MVLNSIMKLQTILISVSLMLMSCVTEPEVGECELVPEVGRCLGLCPTYYFNQSTNQCEEFITGCCGVEVFNTIEECQNICEDWPHSSTSIASKIF